MAKTIFAKSENQAASVMREIQGRGKEVESKGSVRNYEQSLKLCCDYLKEYKLGGLRDITPEIATQYLTIRGSEVGIDQLTMDKNALQVMMRHVTHKLGEKASLGKVTSDFEKIKNSRSYTPEQVEMITSRQTEAHALSTNLCVTGGLRAHELLTLRAPGELAPSVRENIHADKFKNLPNESLIYTVTGKGGLIREVAIPTYLAQQLESYRRDTPLNVTDRKISYQSNYDIPGGLRFSSAFSKASHRALNYSNGAHGLRHTYAQDRYEQLANDYSQKDVMLIISQELGHFRPEITEVYLR